MGRVGGAEGFVGGEDGEEDGDDGAGGLHVSLVVEGLDKGDLQPGDVAYERMLGSMSNMMARVERLNWKDEEEWV